MTTILGISIFLFVLGVSLALRNFLKATNSFEHGRLDLSGASGMFRRHIWAIFFIFLGVLGTLISGITLIVQAFAK